MSTEYVGQRGGAYLVTGTRVSLDSIVFAFISGQSAESIAQSFPVLTLEQVYGATTFYLAADPMFLQEARGREEAEPARSLNGSAPGRTQNSIESAQRVSETG